MVTALYRRYRPENFAELIGQSQVTDPLRTALRTDRVNHAYLFSGPRGCGKTTSARILARCLNCVEGPTDTPCGVCPSCVELSRDGGGSMDVVEIDAASHNGVDDARDIRDRAVFAPARDRFKIFILDEAHMVTPQGFNALLKIVEEPPEHVKFIFATTEPEKVIGTIRSRTHHYPFRLVPPAQMLEYVQSLCVSEGVEVEGGVLPLVVRAGGGSVRDTLSILDQLIAGSDGSLVQYERAVALLGYTHGALLGEVVDALGARDAAAAFTAVDRVIQTGQDPRRFVEDLLERLRDLIVVSAYSVGSVAEGAAAVLRGIQQDELDRMAAQAAHFGTAELSRAADVVNAALTEMTGATSPRLHLELMIARVLVPASDDSQRGALARVERLERRIGVAGPDAPRSVPEPVSVPEPGPTPPVPNDRASDRAAVPVGSEGRPAAPAPAPSAPVEVVTEVQSPTISAGTIEEQKPVAVKTPPAAGTVTLQHVKDAWPEILEAVSKAKRAAWMVVYTAEPVELRDGNILVLTFQSQSDVDALKQVSAPGEGVADHLKQAVLDVLGFKPLLIARADSARPGAPAAAQPPAPAPVVAPAQAAAPVTSAAPAAAASAATAPAVTSIPTVTMPVTHWVTAQPPVSDPAPVAASVPASAVPAAAPVAPAAPSAPVDDMPPYDDVPPEPREPDIEPPLPPDGMSWATAAITDAEPETRPARAPERNAPTAEKPAPEKAASVAEAPAAPTRPVRTPVAMVDGKQRYGESVVREILGASFIEEQAIAPRVAPREQ
ncbi:DNA polymerase III subunit gamma and tau [Lacisediminihabitans changchengi]|uniref:DNA polymerase III subunit gamma/tau n=1 Tax=Lacisediminihabitans changchengi TaxID=2787634 RepID=A0A934W5P9_9MICO|nr:DNA polymerase III subunit gamma and tau [Lacisediminihabitans changchengi]MBK4348765.1 DNA polymerase III subunit gamma and tau [Lacisediminihabitans changchengi]